MPKVIALAAVLTFLGADLALAQLQRPLRIDQVEQLIPVLPDKALAREIRQRGVDFRVDSSVLQNLKHTGAGIETVAALTALLPAAQLSMVSVPPHCNVSLNGHPLGETDDAGRLTINELDAGPSTLQVSKDGYRSQIYDVSFVQNKTTELSATLNRVMGYLSISTTPLDSTVTVLPKSEGDMAGDSNTCTALAVPRNKWECPPGQYTVSASHSGFHSAMDTARVRDGETTNLSLDLHPESAAPGSGVAMPMEGSARRPEPLNPSTQGRNGKDLGSLRLLGSVQNAMGGKDKIKAIKDWQLRATEIWEPSRGTTKLTTTFVAPSSLREETIGGNKTVNYSNGLRGWTWSSSHRVSRDLPVATATGMLFRTLNTLVLSDDDPEVKASLIVPGTIIFSDKYHNTATLTVDSHTWLPRRLSWRNLDGATLEETYSDWRRVGGVMTWFHMTRARDGNRFLEVQVRDFRVNKGLTAAHLSAAP